MKTPTVAGTVGVLNNSAVGCDRAQVVKFSAGSGRRPSQCPAAAGAAPTSSVRGCRPCR
jgi:hypothetical protein